MTKRDRIQLELEPVAGVDTTAALKAALKRLLRDHGLRCTACQVAPGDGSGWTQLDRQAAAEARAIRRLTDPEDRPLRKPR